MDIDEFNLELSNLWDEYSKKFKEKTGVQAFLCPTPYIYDKTNIDFVCVGLNPSFDTNWWYKIIKDNKPDLIETFNKENVSEEYIIEKQDDKLRNNEIQKIVEIERHQIVSEFFKYNNNTHFKNILKQLKDLESLSLENHSYFRKFEDLAETLYGNRNQYIHLDLFSYKVTNSKELGTYINKVPIFFEEQLKLFKKVIADINPKIILVANADASRIFKLLYFDNKERNFLNNFHKEFKHELYLENDNNLYNKEFGYYSINNSDCKVFFSGMLTQQRALDLDSFDRLKLILKKYKLSIEKLN